MAEENAGSESGPTLLTTWNHSAGKRYFFTPVLVKASCENRFFEFANKHWRKLDGDCRGEAREYKVERDEGEVRAIRAAYRARRASGFYKISLRSAFDQSLQRASRLEDYGEKNQQMIRVDRAWTGRRRPQQITKIKGSGCRSGSA